MQASRVLNLNPYKPGEQPKDRVYIKLNANENPYPPSPEVTKAIIHSLKESSMKLALYPDPNSTDLRKAIANLLNATGGHLCRTTFDSCGNPMPALQDKLPFEITSDMIFAGNGSDEVLSFVFYSFFEGDRPLIQPEHTYSFYPVYAGYYDIPLIKVPLKKDFSLDLEKMVQEANLYNSSMIFANPNAPSSIYLSRQEIREMLKVAPKNRVHVVDEAYGDFGGESCLPLLSEFNNLVIVRTFSKSLSFAGMRLGYAVSNPELIKTLFCVKDSFNHFPVDYLAQVAAKAACKDVAYYVNTAKMICKERDLFAKFLQEKGWEVLPSATNFIFTYKKGIKGKAAYEYIKSKGILVRRFDIPGIEEYLRITIGNHEQMEELRKIFQDLESR